MTATGGRKNLLDRHEEQVIPEMYKEKMGAVLEGTSGEQMENPDVKSAYFGL
jgi:hypothetical protein